MSHLLLTLAMGLISGLLCYHLAERRNKDSLLWSLLGFFFGLLALLILYFLPKAKLSQAKEPSIPRQASATASVTGPTLPPAEPREASQLSGLPATISLDNYWYYLDKGWHQKGPCPLSRVQEEYQRGHIDLQTYLWHPSLPNWMAFEAIEALRGEQLPTLKGAD